MTVKADAHFVDCDRATGDGGSWQSDQYATLSFVGAVVNSRGSESWFLDAAANGYAHIPAYDSSVNAQAMGAAISPTEQIVAFADVPANGADSCINLFTFGGVPIDVTFALGDDFDATWTVIRDIAYSYDGAYIFCCQETPASYLGNRVMKWNASTGALEWIKNIGGVSSIPGPRVVVDADGYCYSMANNYEGVPYLNVIKFNPDGTTAVQLPPQPYRGSPALGWTPTGLSNFAIDDENGVFYAAYGSSWSPYAPQGIVKCRLSDLTMVEYAINTGFGGGSIIYYKNYLYHCESKTDPTLYKIDPANLGGIVADTTSTGMTGYSPSFSIAGENSIIVPTHRSLGNGGSVYEFDLDLNLIEEHESSSLTEQPLDGGARVEVIAYPEAWVQAGGAPYGVIASQYRTVAYPQDWAHLEGQTVQVLKDGIYIGDEAVSGGQITLDD